MCTVSYIPTGKSSFILSSNRDESPTRPVSGLHHEFINGEEVIFPKEVKEGSWIFASSADQVICILNGSSERHIHNPPYRKSRGLIMLDYFQFEDSIEFLKNIDLHNIEPFTMIIRDRSRFFESIWDGQIKKINRLDPSQKYIWSSTTLYTKEQKQEREQWFHDWFLNKSEIDLEEVKMLHKNGGKHNKDYGFVMNRDNIVCTLSITHIVKSPYNIEMHYEDLIKNETIIEKINVNQFLV